MTYRAHGHTVSVRKFVGNEVRARCRVCDWVRGAHRDDEITVTVAAVRHAELTKLVIE